MGNADGVRRGPDRVVAVALVDAARAIAAEARDVIATAERVCADARAARARARLLIAERPRRRDNSHAGDRVAS